MDMRLDEAGHHPPAVEPPLRRALRQIWCDSGDLALADADIGGPLRLAGDARFTQDQIEIHETLRFFV